MAHRHNILGNPTQIHDQATIALDQHQSAVQNTHKEFVSEIERKHDEAQRAMDNIAQQARQDHEHVKESRHQGDEDKTRKRSSSKGRANSKGRRLSRGRSGSKGKPPLPTNTTTSGVVSNQTGATTRLDELRQEQQRRFDQFNADLNKVNMDYGSSYGKTSFGTPVNRDDPNRMQIGGPNQNFSGMVVQTNSGYQTSGLRETQGLDKLREEQKSRFQTFANSASTSHSEYNSKYGKTSMGTPVHRDGNAGPHSSIYTIDHVDNSQPIDLNRFLQVLNDVRARPAYYSDRIKAIYFKPDGKHVNHYHEPDYTEGSRVYTDGYEFLRAIPSLPPLRLDPGLTAVAYDQAMFLCHENRLGNAGPNGEVAAQRVNRYGTLMSGNVAENNIKSRELSYEVTVLNMVIDDGVPNRGRRLNIFSPEFTKVGLAAAKHKLDSAYFIDMVFATEGYVSNSNSISAQTRNMSGLDLYHTTTGGRY